MARPPPFSCDGCAFKTWGDREPGKSRRSEDRSPCADSFSSPGRLCLATTHGQGSGLARNYPWQARLKWGRVWSAKSCPACCRGTLCRRSACSWKGSRCRGRPCNVAGCLACAVPPRGELEAVMVGLYGLGEQNCSGACC